MNSRSCGVIVRPQPENILLCFGETEYFLRLFGESPIDILPELRYNGFKLQIVRESWIFSEYIREYTGFFVCLCVFNFRGSGE